MGGGGGGGGRRQEDVGEREGDKGKGERGEVREGYSTWCY